MAHWMMAYNIVVLLVACGLSTSFYYYTGSMHSFWWMLLLATMNSVEITKTTTREENRNG